MLVIQNMLTMGESWDQRIPGPRVLSLPERFVGDPVSLARDNILRYKGY